MKKNELKRELSLLKIPSDSYSIDEGSKDEALCLESNYEKWSIYYSEKGCRTDEVFYSNEDEACQKFLFRIMKMLGLS